MAPNLLEISLAFSTAHSLQPDTPERIASFSLMNLPCTIGEYNADTGEPMGDFISGLTDAAGIGVK
jgi:hypothetical protein